MRSDEYQAGEGQLIVVYTMADRGEMIWPADMWKDIAADAANRAASGWRIVSTSSMTMRQMGTAGNMFFQSGGQYVTQDAVTVVYAK